VENLYTIRESLKAKEVAVFDNESQWESVVDERLGVESEIIDAPITSVVDIIVKLEIIAKESEIFGDVSERLNQLRDQIAKFADGNVIRLIGRDD
jgi:hypothetical protein